MSSSCSHKARRVQVSNPTSPCMSYSLLHLPVPTSHSLSSSPPCIISFFCSMHIFSYYITAYFYHFYYLFLYPSSSTGFEPLTAEEDAAFQDFNKDFPMARSKAASESAPPAAPSPAPVWQPTPFPYPSPSLAQPMPMFYPPPPSGYGGMQPFFAPPMNSMPMPVSWREENSLKHLSGPFLIFYFILIPPPTLCTYFLLLFITLNTL